jgi:hypothetical protein
MFFLEMALALGVIISLLFIALLLHKLQALEHSLEHAMQELLRSINSLASVSHDHEQRVIPITPRRIFPPAPLETHRTVEDIGTMRLP